MLVHIAAIGQTQYTFCLTVSVDTKYTKQQQRLVKRKLAHLCLNIVHDIELFLSFFFTGIQQQKYENNNFFLEACSHKLSNFHHYHKVIHGTIFRVR